MPAALPLAAALVAPSETEFDGKLWLTAERAALAEMGDPLGRPGAIQNLSLAFSVAASALTIAYKTRAGANASATDPISVAMRNATLATMDFNVRNITAALSLVVPSTATLGHTSAVAGDLYHYVIDNAGVLEPAVSMKYFGQQGIVSTTTIAAASNSPTTMYSTTGRAAVPFRCVGHTIDTQATAGTWAAVPTTSELAPFDVGLKAALAYVFDGGGAVLTTGIKGDVSVPFACTINSATLLADQSGSIVVDVWKDTFANYPPTVADTITAAAKPTISAATKSEDTTLTGWTTAIAAGDTLRFNVDSITTIQRCVLILKVTKT